MQKKKFASVLVYGDIGRSPRMQNHVIQLLKNTEYYIYLIGYCGKIKQLKKTKKN